MKKNSDSAVEKVSEDTGIPEKSLIEIAKKLS